MAKILIVEDDESLSKMYQDKFRIEKFEVISANNGEDGLNLAFKEHPDIMLLDVMMPKMDGITTMARIREDDWGRNVPIIILSNLETSDKILKGIVESQPAYYLLKEKNTPEGVFEKVKQILNIK